MTRTFSILSGIAVAATLAAGATTPAASADGKELAAGAGGKKIGSFSELQGITTKVDPIESRSRPRKVGAGRSTTAKGVGQLKPKKARP